MKGLQLTTEETQLLLEALLFSSSVDICSDWTDKQRKDLITLAKKLNDKSITLGNIYFMKFEESEAYEKQLLTDFPNLPITTVKE